MLAEGGWHFADKVLRPGLRPGCWHSLGDRGLLMKLDGGRSWGLEAFVGCCPLRGAEASPLLR
eukprot:8153319-Prorocentrum_lima.AAC.1